jgi:hypothetical protein
MGEDLADLPWDEAAFNAWAEVDEEAERLVEMNGEVRFSYGCVWDALEIVDWRSGEIRDREINQLWDYALSNEGLLPSGLRSPPLISGLDPTRRPRSLSMIARESPRSNNECQRLQKAT